MDPRPCQLTRQIRSFTFGNPSSACPPVRPRPPVRQSANPSTRPPPRLPVRPLSAPVRSFAQRARPYPLIRPPVRPSARPLGAVIRLCARPPTLSASSASYHPWSLAYKFLAVEAERALCLSVSQDYGFSLEDPLRETYCTGGHPALVRGHGIVLEYYVVLCLVGSASRACPLCHSVSQDCGFSLEDPLHETHCIGGHPTLVSVRYCFADCSTIQDCLLNKATLGFWCLAPFIFAGSCLKQCHVGMMRGIIGMMIWGFCRQVSTTSKVQILSPYYSIQGR